jgi:hypothetical protein
VRVYAGVDPLSGTRLYLTETVPAGPKALAETKKVRTRLIGQIDEQRNPAPVPRSTSSWIDTST